MGRFAPFFPSTTSPLTLSPTSWRRGRRNCAFGVGFDLRFNTPVFCALVAGGFFRILARRVNNFEAQLKLENGRRSLGRLLEPLHGLPGVQFEALGGFRSEHEEYSLPRFTLRGPNSSDPIRIGIFAAIHGDEPAGALAVAAFLRESAKQPELIENFLLQVYPVCNPTGFEDNTRHSRRGKDLNREFWKASSEPEVELLEHELRTQHFSGIIQLHADDTSDGLYGFVRGHTLTENLLRPALAEAGKILPRNINATIDGFAARDGIIYTSYQGILAAPMQAEPPFEIIFETPHHAPMELQVAALVVAVRTILKEYRQLISFAANL
jgi:protein MpaA